MKKKMNGIGTNKSFGSDDIDFIQNFNNTSSYFASNNCNEKLAAVNIADNIQNEGFSHNKYGNVNEKNDLIINKHEKTPLCIVSKFFNKQNVADHIYECDCVNSDCSSEILLNRSDSDQIPIDEDVREFSLSQLDVFDGTLPIPKFFNITPREIPISPHKVIEEGFKSNPWTMLVATIFLTKTTAKAAKPFMKQFFVEFPSPYELINVDPSKIESYFETLGMRKRAHMIWKMSHEFVSAKWRRASDLCGIGKYGEDAYRLFCLGHTDVEPTDRYLRLYLDWLKSQTDYVESWSRIESEDLIFDPVKDYYAISLK